MAYSPYQIAGTKASLIDLLQEGAFDRKKSAIETRKQKGKMREEFEAELEAAQAEARKKAKSSPFSKVLNLVGLGLGPLGAALTSGITAGYEGNKQRKAMESLLSGVDSKRWGKTFLRDPMKAYKQEAEDMQMSSGDVLRGAFGSGLTSFMTSKMLGGDAETGGLFKKMSEAKKLASDEMIKGAITKSPEGVIEMAKEFPIEKLKGVSPEALLSENPAFQQLIESFKKIGTGGAGVSDELKSAMMLPMLLQQILGE
jgi:hypothetical protein